MKPIAYNYLGDLVFEDDELIRHVGRSPKNLTRESEETGIGQALRCDASRPEAVWLCALAFAAQPSLRVIPINEFFKICTTGLPQIEREKTLPLFIVDCLHAFYRINNHLIDSDEASMESLAIVRSKFENFGLPKAIARIPTLSQVATPESVQLLRAVAMRRTISTPILGAPFFNPFDQTLTAAHVLAAGEKPWSVHFGNEEGLQAIRPAGGFDTASATISHSETGSVLTHPQLRDPVHFRPGDAINQLRARHQTQIGESGRHPYDPITGSVPADSAITTSLLQAHRTLRAKTLDATPAWDEHVAGLLHLSSAEMRARMSAEQIDACGIATNNFALRKSFILADETGLGKGRTLAALAKAFIDSGRKVMFVTEKKHLFSDFWRDLIAVFGAPPPVPFLLHPKGRILGSDGAAVAKALTPTKYKAHLATHDSGSPLLFTTYSQFNRDAKHADKFLMAQRHLEGGLLILDESHNASGESQTRANIAAFIEASGKCVFSSATYAKHEQAFELYASATPLTKNQMALLLASFGGADPLAASNALAHGLVQIGSMVRREHRPDTSADTQIITPTPGQQESINAQRHELHLALDALFSLQGQIDVAKARLGEEVDSSWIKLGGTLSRVSRQFNLLSKLDLACDSAIELLAQDKKPVLALESTFEAFMRAQLGAAMGQPAAAMLDDDATEDEDGPSKTQSYPRKTLNFQSLFALIVETVAPVDLVERLGSSLVRQAKTTALSSAESLPDWLASPIDNIRHRLTSRGYSVGEISGRSIQIDNPDDPNLINVSPRSSDERESIVRAFNAGKIDVLILTQAGASGISLHSSKDFEDRRTRAFVELEICANPSQRMQFLGRVRRKGQVNSPEYFAISSGTPYEHRLIERAASKQQKLSGMTSATQNLAAGALTTASQIMTPRGDRIALEWLKGNFDSARRLGIHPAYATLDGESVAEKLLKRLPLLPAIEQDEVFAFLNAGLATDALTPIGEPPPYLFSPVLARTAPIWGPASVMAESETPKPFEPCVHMQEWICIPPVANLGSVAVEERLAAANEKQKARFIDHLSQAADLALRSGAATMDSKARANNLHNVAAHLVPGSKIRVSHPHTGRPLDGIVIDISPPSNDDWILFPSQWTIDAIFPGMPFELSFSLATFFDDPFAYLEKAAPPSPKIWNTYQERPLHLATIAGHCGYSRWYANQYGARVTARFVDSKGSYHEESTFPNRVTLVDAAAWKIPLIDPRLTLQLMQHDVHLALDNSKFPHELPTAKISPTGGGWNLSLERNLHDGAVDYILDRRLGPRKYSHLEHLQFVTRFVSVRDIHAVMTMLHNRQCRFFAPASRARWHATALELLLSTAKPAKKTKGR